MLHGISGGTDIQFSLFTWSTFSIFTEGRLLRYLQCLANCPLQLKFYTWYPSLGIGSEVFSKLDSHISCKRCFFLCWGSVLSWSDLSNKIFKSRPIGQECSHVSQFLMVIIDFLSAKVWLSASDGLIVAERSFRWVSLFFILHMKISLIHSAYLVSIRLHVIAKSVRAPQKCSIGSRSCCLRFDNLYLSKVVLTGLLKVVSSGVQNSVNEKLKFLPENFFWAKNPYPSLLSAKNKIERSFLSASAGLIPLKFLFSSFILFSSTASYTFIAFLFLASLLTLSEFLPVGCSRIGNSVSCSSGQLMLSMSRFFRNYRLLELVAPLCPGMWWL